MPTRVGLGAGQPGDAHQPAHALGDLVDAAAVGVGAVLAEARDRAVDEARVAGAHGVVVEAEAGLHRRAHVLDEHVGGVDQAQQQLETFRLSSGRGRRRACCDAGSGSRSRGGRPSMPLGSPCGGGSTRITSAPQSASCRTHVGPAPRDR